jgi:hypothetical protein
MFGILLMMVILYFVYKMSLNINDLKYDHYTSSTEYEPTPGSKQKCD